MWETDEKTLDQTDLREPPMFKVYLNNDDYTPMDFVVMVLVTIFHKDSATAQRIMLNIHRKGRGLCGIYPHAVAETKVRQVEALAEKNRFPLHCCMEEDG
jgi:ATP-dependent Clp protease adaptor protein ClpS